MLTGRWRQFWYIVSTHRWQVSGERAPRKSLGKYLGIRTYSAGQEKLHHCAVVIMQSQIVRKLYHHHYHHHQLKQRQQVKVHLITSLILYHTCIQWRYLIIPQHSICSSNSSNIIIIITYLPKNQYKLQYSSVKRGMIGRKTALTAAIS